MFILPICADRLHSGLRLLFTVCWLFVAGAMPAGGQLPTDEFEQLVKLARGYMQERRFEQGLEAWRKAYDLKPSSSVLAQMGKTFMALGMATEAADVMHHALEQGGQVALDVRHNHGLGFCLGTLWVSADHVAWISMDPKENFLAARDIANAEPFESVASSESRQTTGAAFPEFRMRVLNKNWRFEYMLYGHGQYPYTNGAFVLYSGDELARADRATRLILRLITGMPSSKQITAGAASGLPPSNSFAKFEHADYVISYPDNWQIIGDKESDVTIAPVAGMSSKDGVAYGAFIAVFQPNNAGTFDDATRQLIDSLLQENPGWHAVGTAQENKLRGLPSKSIESIGPSPFRVKGTARGWLVAFQRNDGALLYASFEAPEREFEQLRPTFQSILQSLEPRVGNPVSTSTPLASGGQTASTENAPAEPKAEAAQPIRGESGGEQTKHSGAPVELKEGEPPEEVQRLLGKPTDSMTLRGSLIYIYPTVKVIFENGKLVDVQYQQK